MLKAMKDPKEGFAFREVPQDELYYKDVERSLVELTLEDSGLKRLCFLHRGNPNPRQPQLDAWTCSDVETGLACGVGGSASDAKADAERQFAKPDATRRLIASVAAFINEFGKANLVPNRPVIREGTVVAWGDEDEKQIKWGTVTGKRDHLNPENGVACLITKDPFDVVRMVDVIYVWPTREDLICPSN